MAQVFTIGERPWSDVCVVRLGAPVTMSLQEVMTWNCAVKSTRNDSDGRLAGRGRELADSATEWGASHINLLDGQCECRVADAGGDAFNLTRAARPTRSSISPHNPIPAPASLRRDAVAGPPSFIF